MKFKVKYDVTNEKDMSVIEQNVLMQFAASYINQFKDKMNYEVVIEEKEEEINVKIDNKIEKEKVNKKYAIVSMDMIIFKDVIKPQRINNKINKEKVLNVSTKTPKEKKENEDGVK